MQFGNTELNVIETGDSKQWCMTIDEVAKGYDVGRTAIMNHLTNHQDEIREGVERGVSICDTLGGSQQLTVIYREGVIKLGFFIRSKQAATFRQWATNLVVQHLEHNGTDMSQLLGAINEFRGETNAKFAGVEINGNQNIDDVKPRNDSAPGDGNASEG